MKYLSLPIRIDNNLIQQFAKEFFDKHLTKKQIQELYCHQNYYLVQFMSDMIANVMTDEDKEEAADYMFSDGSPLPIYQGQDISVEDIPF